ncbi:hypothetical protein B0T11DRAFT_297069 [Plectosphaerella cucumerina]|uniref:Uncharacterized protein n=1 Tax=Plectosphaerella cucumerina TaxID=40658 RepID=A0A8K0THE2_9PEZI|nr:hypothetical protein B0T11DRAFT_297069 [Plectosphaerella cucumerina]
MPSALLLRLGSDLCQRARSRPSASPSNGGQAREDASLCKRIPDNANQPTAQLLLPQPPCVRALRASQQPSWFAHQQACPVNGPGLLALDRAFAKARRPPAVQLMLGPALSSDHPSLRGAEVRPTSSIRRPAREDGWTLRLRAARNPLRQEGGVAAVAPLRIHIHLGQSKTVCRSDVIISTDPVSRKKIDEGGEEFTRELSGQGASQAAAPRPRNFPRLCAVAALETMPWAVLLPSIGRYVNTGPTFAQEYRLAATGNTIDKDLDSRIADKELGSKSVRSEPSSVSRPR